LEDIVDVDSWFRGMAYAVLSGAGDNAGSGSQHNGMYYARPDGRIMFLPHDMDFGAAGGNPTASIFANRECSKLANSNSTPGNAQRRRIYFGILHDIVTTTWNSAYMSDFTTHLASLDSSQNWAGKLSSFDQRRNYVLSQINNSITPTNFSITTLSPLTVASSTATISGKGWVNVREIRLAGSSDPRSVEWTDGNSWAVNIPVAPGSHAYRIEAYDFSGELINTDTITIDNNGTVEPASALNLAVSELMYNPSDPTAAEVNTGFIDADLFEFIELTNIGTLDVDLTGVSFTAGINYDLPAIIIPTGMRVILARNRAAFLLRHPGTAPFLLAGEYGIGDANKLANGGEQVVIEDALGGDIRRFTYDDKFPWPNVSDGDGPSLVLIAPDTNPDHAFSSNWRASAASGGNPGSSEAKSFVGDPNADLDKNGVRDLVDHALLGDGSQILSFSGSTVGFEFNRDLAADDVVVGLQVSTDLSNWTNGSELFSALDPIYLGTGGQRIRYEAQSSELPAERFFIRLQVVLTK
ncbi:lamin tail domain-containing protein, partial [bacterium]|nr:lamin tail domain-containing protein [bacterium]